MRLAAMQAVFFGGCPLAFEAYRGDRIDVR
jgi:hypothetical protein